MPVSQKPTQLIVRNETVPDSDPGTRFEAGARLNYVNHIANDGAVPILISFDDPHPATNVIEVKASESLNDHIVAGGFQSLYIRGVGGTPSIRVLANYRTDLPDQYDEWTGRDGNLEVLREIRDGIQALRSEPSSTEAEETVTQDREVDIALGLDGEQRAGIDLGALLPILLIGGVVLTLLWGGQENA